MTTKEQSLEGLIERVRAATGPDRELSRDIWQALDTPEWKAAYLRAQEPCGCPHDQAVEYAARYLFDLTASIDAALDLVERLLPGRSVVVGLSSNPSPYCGIAPSTLENAPTAPLAILTALLTALKDASE